MVDEDDLFDLELPPENIIAIELLDGDNVCPRCDGKLQLIAENEEVSFRQDTPDPFLLVACGEYKCILCALHFMSVRRIDLRKATSD